MQWTGLKKRDNWHIDYLKSLILAKTLSKEEGLSPCNSEAFGVKFESVDVSSWGWEEIVW